MHSDRVWFNSILNYMVYVFWSNLYSIFRNEQELCSYIKWLSIFGFVFGTLLTILKWKYQSPDISLFDIHGALMLLLIIDVCIFTISMAVTILPTFNRTHHPFFKGVFLISRIFACDLVFFMLVPPFGWFIFTICVFVLVLLLYHSHEQILQPVKKLLNQCGTPLQRHSTVYVIGSNNVSNQSGQQSHEHPLNPRCLLPMWLDQ